MTTDLDLEPDLAFADATIAKILESEDFDEVLAWAQEPGRLSASLPLVDPDMEKPLAAALARILWNATPLPSNGFRPKPLPMPGRNDPCICGSGRKYKHCCADLPPLLDIKPAHIWAIAVEHLTPEQLEQAHAVRAIPADLLSTLGEHYLKDGQGERAVELLEPLFTDSLDRLDARYEHALHVLCDAYEACGRQEYKRKLLERVSQEASRPLRGSAWERLASILADEGDFPAAWRAFHEAQRATPGAPSLSILEVTLLTDEGRIEEAKQRARFWRRRLEKTPEMPPEVLELLDRFARDPHQAMGQVVLLNDSAARLVELVENMCERPIPEYALVMLDELQSDDEEPESDAAGIQEDLFASMHEEKTAIWMIEPPRRLQELEARWHEHYPLGKPFSVQPFPMEEEIDPWGSKAAEGWLGFLEAHPECFDSLDILDDLAMSIDRDYGNWREIADRVYGPLLERGAAILDKLEAQYPEGLRLEWGFLENRPALRLLVKYAFWLQEQGQRERALHRMEQLLRLNPNDNHGIRCILSRAYLERGDDAAMLELYRRFEDDIHVEIPFGAALAHYRRGEKAMAQKALLQGHRCNRHVIPMLTAKRPKRPKLDPHGITLGGRDQAWLYREFMLDLWRATPGALEWLKKQKPS